jgi:hypothetical protein
VKPRGAFRSQGIEDDNVSGGISRRKERAVNTPSGRRVARLGLLPLLAATAACGSPTSPPPATASANVPSATAPSAIGSAAASAGATAAASPSIEPSPTPAGPSGSAKPAFGSVIDNPWFPLKPGTTLVYRGVKDGEKVVDTVQVTSDTKVIDGVTCVTVHDELTIGGAVEERTDDWYAQDVAGDVWYFGEDTAELDAAGKVTSTEGTWASGIDGATAGIFMPADPQIGESHVQEFYAGHAEDHFVVLLTDTSIKVPAGSWTGALLTGEWTPLEPAVFTEKVYVRGIGEVREADVEGGDEHLEMVSVSP